MSKVTVKYEDGLKTDLADPFEAVAYLNAALEEGSQASSAPSRGTTQAPRCPVVWGAMFLTCEEL